MSGAMNAEQAVALEEGRARAYAAERTSETNGGSLIQAANFIQNVNWECCLGRFIMEKFKNWDDISLQDENPGDEEGSGGEKIRKVPDVLFKKPNLKQYFEPRMVSLGPYKHGRENLNLEVTEEKKIKLADMFIKRRLKVGKERVCLEFKMQIQDLKKCYEEEVTELYSDDDLALMFLVDGCVVLHFIEYFADLRSRNKNLDGLEQLEMNQDLRFAMDLFLLKNQLPYKVLDIIIRSCQSDTDAQELRKSIKEFIIDTAHIIKTEDDQELHPLDQLPEEPIHLLHLLRRSFVQPARNKEKSCCTTLVTKMSSPRVIIDIIRLLLFPFIWFVRHIVVVIVIRIMYVLHGVLIPHRRMPKMITLHNVEELKIAGIEFRPSDTDHFTNITFSNGTLKLPPISVTRSTAYMFLNLAAYEMISTDAQIHYEVCFFIFFLSTLISKAEDVKELRDNNILYNYLDADQEVVQLFKELNIPDLKVTFEGNYRDIYKQIQNHCDNRLNAWMAELKQNYFRSPWTVIAWLAAIVGLSLTAIKAFHP